MEPISFKDLKGKVCVITGGSGVIGSEMVKAMASVGVKIAVGGSSTASAEKAAAKLAAEFDKKLLV